MNYLSQEYKIQQPQSNVDLQVVDKTLATLQGKYDANKSQIDQTLAQYSQNLKGLTALDNEYIADKLKQVKTQIDNYSKKNSNLAYNYNKDSILTAITSVMSDPLVQDIVISKQNYDKYNSEISELQKKNPEKVNNANYAFGLHQGGYYDYMQGKSKKLGAMQYTPYVDLQEKHFKDLKAIKDLKGKRFIETVDPNNPGQTIRKEIDGLTKSEISDYFSSSLSGQERMQMQINGWSKYAQPNTIASSKQMYSDYTNQVVKNKEQDLYKIKADAKNPLLGADKKEIYKRQAEEIEYEIRDLKNLDASKLSPDTIAFELEKANYTNSISNIASTEWSTSIDKNDAYFAEQDLDIKRQNLMISAEKLNIEKLKLAKDYSVDSNGNPLYDGVMAKSTRETTTPDLESGAGMRSLKTDFDNATNTILSTAQDFMKNASSEDKENFTNYLKARGVNSNLQFEEGKGEGKSLSLTISGAFEEGNFAQAYPEYGKAIGQARTIRTESANNIINAEKEAIYPKYLEDKARYIDRLTSNPSATSLSLLNQRSADKFQEVNNFYKKLTGTDLVTDSSLTEQEKAYKFRTDINLKRKLREAINTKVDGSNITELNSVLEKVNKYHYQSKVSLVEDAKQEIEKIIQSKTNKGLMTSTYSDFTITDDKIKENILKMIPTERTFMKGSNVLPAYLSRDKDTNTSFYRSGQDIIMTQQVKGKEGGTITNQTILSPGDSAYSEILNYLDFDKSSNKDIQITADTKFTPSKVKVASHGLDSETTRRKSGAILNAVQNNPSISNIFTREVGFDPMVYATQETIDEAVDIKLNQYKVPQEKIDIFKNTLKGSLNNYSLLPKSSYMTGVGNTLALEVQGMKNPLTMNLGTNVLDEDLNYLIKYHPQTFIVNQLLFKIKEKQGKNIDYIINSL